MAQHIDVGTNIMYVERFNRHINLTLHYIIDFDKFNSQLLQTIEKKSEKQHKQLLIIIENINKEYNSVEEDKPATAV